LQFYYARDIKLRDSADAEFYYNFWRTIMATVQNSTASSGLAEVVDRILDKGIVVDAWIKVSLVGIELLSIEARVVIASVETYLKYAEAIGLTASAATPA
jgi:hypothetical protein|tara:strand:+ start:1617 stop:1916 length:300 start_codon:yes stop_codon:yes gene_type:complete